MANIFSIYHHCFLFSFLCFLLLIQASAEGPSTDDECRVSRCSGRGPPIRFPFRLKGIQPDRCGYRGFDLSCNQNKQTVIELPDSVNMVVSKIDYISQKIHLHDPLNCLPRPLPGLNLSVSPFAYSSDSPSSNFDLFYCWVPRSQGYSVPCLGSAVYAISSLHSDAFDITSCSKLTTISSVPDDIFQDQENLVLSWDKPNCTECESNGKICSLNNYNGTVSSAGVLELQCLQPKPATGVRRKILIAGLVLGALLLVIALFCAYTLYKIKEGDRIKIAKFLEDYKAMKTRRYTFADIKKITNKFKEKLGEGAYGTVFKGKLSTEILVAVKVLNDSTGNEDDFINEVKTMGTIHHVNVVRLVGFCADGSKRALVYEFVPNESLEKLLFSENKKRSSLDWEKLQDIAIGTAKGIEYLHQGCDYRMLHFDIKPHNVLLDQNFVPKITDFGLAKLCSKDQSIVSMTAVGGTMGYIAPEVLSRNFGNVSYKSDVYSFGMLLLEMVGGRKNIDVAVQNSSEAYFPEWIYNRLISQEEDREKWFEESENEVIAKRLTVVGLWCIQMRPADRPSMKNVVQMLEGEGEAIPMPSNPFASATENKNSSKPAASAFNIEFTVIANEE